MMTRLIPKIILVIATCFLISFKNQTTIIGQKYIGYTKHPECEIMTTTLVLNENKTFEYNRFCKNNSKKDNLKKKTIGNWKELNDSTLILSNNGTITWEIRIKSEEIIEILSENRISNFILEKVK